MKKHDLNPHPADYRACALKTKLSLLHCEGGVANGIKKEKENERDQVHFLRDLHLSQSWSAAVTEHRGCHH